MTSGGRTHIQARGHPLDHGAGTVRLYHLGGFQLDEKLRLEGSLSTYRRLGSHQPLLQGIYRLLAMIEHMFVIPDRCDTSEGVGLGQDGGGL